MTQKIVLAYSGGLDTSVILKWLKETYQAPVAAFIADVGQDEDMEAIAAKARRTGADTVHVLDLREEFVRDYVFFALKANAIYEGHYLMGTSIARPLIAKHQIAVARLEGADALAHGATGKGNDQVRFELTARALAPDLAIIAPWRTWSFTGRNDLFNYAEQHGIALPVTKDKPYSMDANLMHISYEGGILEDPWAAPPPDIFLMTKNPEEAPDAPLEISISFVDGVPVAVDGAPLGPVALLTRLNVVGGDHGVGRVDIVENRFIGMKSRGVYETPGVTLLQLAHRAVESLAMDREVMHLRDSLVPKIAELIYNGFWFSPELNMLRAAVEQSQQGITGTARLRLYKGGAVVIGRRSENSLYNTEIASFETFGTYDSQDAAGFIRMNGLRLALNPALRKEL